MSVVHGATKRPSSGQTHESNARSTRFPKSHIARITKRGPSAAKRRAKQHISGTPHEVGGRVSTTLSQSEACARLPQDASPARGERASPRPDLRFSFRVEGSF